MGSQKNDKANLAFPDKVWLVFLVLTLFLAILLEVWFSQAIAWGLGFFIGFMGLMLFAKKYKVPRLHVMSKALMAAGIGLAGWLIKTLWER